MGLVSEEVNATVNDHRISATAVGTATGITAKLYVDGALVDTTTCSYFFPKRAALVRGQLIDKRKKHVVEVYATGIFNIRLNLKMDGEWLARS